MKGILMITREEFEKTLLRDDVVEYYCSKSKEELSDLLCFEVARMKDYEQKNSHHCYDLLIHTLNVVKNIDITNMDESDIIYLKVSAFFHDIGKPDTVKFNDKTNQQVFYGHSIKSAEIAGFILEKLKYNAEDIRVIKFLIEHHDDFISYKIRLEDWAVNHLFLRDINPSSVAEKLLENTYDFKAMGYNVEEIRVICYSLAHNNELPKFNSKSGPLIINIDIEEVIKKMKSGHYDFKFAPIVDEYNLLLNLCKADMLSQAEVVMQNGKQITSKKEKVNNFKKIEEVIYLAYDIMDNIQ